MSNQVYANNMEIACKQASGKSICAFPDVCFTPPQTPATPPGVPIPYPNTGLASDTTDGSTSVKISGQEIMLKNKSSFKKSSGDEAGAAPKKGVVTSKNGGAVFFNAWSMDVMVEGENVVRHFDLATHNHGSAPGNTIPWLYTDGMDVSKIPAGCKKQADEFNDKCAGCLNGHPDGSINLSATNTAMCENKDCKAARECVLTPYNMGCCDGKTPHHIVPKSQFKQSGAGKYTLPKCVTYRPRDAPCICVDGHSHSEAKHGEIHALTNNETVKRMRSRKDVTGKTIKTGARWTVGEAEEVGAQATEDATGCDAKCTQDQLRKGHQAQGINAEANIRPTTAGGVEDQPDDD